MSEIPDLEAIKEHWDFVQYQSPAAWTTETQGMLDDVDALLAYVAQLQEAAQATIYLTHCTSKLCFRS